MSIEKIFENRVLKLNKKEENTKGKYVLYCMEASQRQEFNHALEFSIYKANYYKKPVLVVFFITDKYKFSNQRYYRFIIEGLIKLKKDLKDRGINFLIIKDDYVNGCIKLSKEACLVVLDKNYLKTQRLWRRKVADFVNVCVYEVESDVIFPIQFLFNKSIPYAFLYRDKVEKFFDYFLLEVKHFEPIIKSNDLNIYLDNVIDFNEVQEYLNILNIDKSISTVEKYYQGGSDIANKLLKEFIEKKLPFYKDNRSDPTLNYTSNLSPYLHFGQISPLKIVIEILKYYDKRDENVKSFFNELIVWRELARNYVYYNEFYNQYEGVPLWARKSLEEHLIDKREYLYTLEELEQGKTHDEYWNAAQQELLITGKMHNYMRMYWAKKIIEWTEHPKQAFDIVCYLNDKYLLDGRDPNGYAGISWCFGNFDRPFKERKIFGKIRYMSYKNLTQRFDVKRYLNRFLKL